MASRLEKLLLFVRFPEAGLVKTRLIPRLGAEGAAAVYRRMAEAVAREAARLARPGLALAALVEPPGRVDDVRRWLGAPWEAAPQADGDLGRRLSAAFAGAFAGGARRVVAAGTDCLDLSAELLGNAFDGLTEHDAVLGPALDGGYYLIGLARNLPSVFEEIPWSTSEVCRLTLERLAEVGARTRLLPALRDLDTPEDLEALLPRWERILSSSGRHPDC